MLWLSDGIKICIMPMVVGNSGDVVVTRTAAAATAADWFQILYEMRELGPPS